MKAAWTLGLLLLMATICRAQLPEPKQSGGKFGYALNGVWVVEPTLQYATHFKEGRALAQQNNLWGYLDSLGNWVVKPAFTNAQPFREGKALVINDTKKGLIRLDGSFLVEPVYEDFEVQYDGVEIRNNGKTGRINTTWSSMIPPDYERIDRVFEYYCAKRTEENYDLYRDGKLLQKGLSKQVQYADVFPDAHLVRVTVGDKKGVIDQLGKWVVQPNYSEIHYHFLGDYFRENAGTTPSILLDLDQTEYQLIEGFEDVFEPVGTSKHFIADKTGKILDPEPFERIDVIRDNTYEGHVARIELQRNNRLGYFERNGLIQMSEWEKIEHYLDWVVYSTSEKTEIRHKSGKMVAGFEQVIVPFHPVIYYDEYGEPHPSDEGLYEYHPYVIAQRTFHDVQQYAIYELNEEAFITDWGESVPELSIHFVDGKTVYTIYRYQGDQLRTAIYVNGSKNPVTSFPYEYVQVLENGVIIGRTMDGKKSVVFEILQNGELNKLTEVAETFLSTDQYTYELIPSEVEGLFEKQYTRLFKLPFILYKNEEGSYGVITILNTKKVFPAYYDTIIQHDTVDELVHTKSKNGWGSIHVADGTAIPAIYPEKLEFRKDESNNRMYTIFMDHYLSAANQTFYSLSAEEPVRVNKLWGTRTTSDFDGSEHMIVPATYKTLYQLDVPERYLVQNKKGLYGVINRFDELIIPMSYSKIETQALFSPLEESDLYRTYIGKKQGMMDPATGATIPALYERVSYTQELYGYDFGIQVFNEGKTGLYSFYKLKEIFPCELDGMWFSTVDNGTEWRVQHQGKWYVEMYKSDAEISLKTLLKNRAYDLIIGDTGYVATSGYYEAYALSNPYVDPVKVKEPTLPSFEINGAFFLQNGKIGVRDAKGKTIIPAEMTLVSKMDESTISSVRNGIQGFYTLPTGKFYTTNEW